MSEPAKQQQQQQQAAADADRQSTQQPANTSSASSGSDASPAVVQGSRRGHEHSTHLEDDFGILNKGSDTMPQNRDGGGAGDEGKGMVGRLGDKVKAMGSEHKMQ